MSLRFFLGCVVLSSLLQSAPASRQKTSSQQKQMDADVARAFRAPKFELRGNLAKIFTVTRCEYISGLTCRIHHNGKLPLPSEVFFTEFDDHGKRAGPRVWLIYPELSRGETGVATFRIRLSRPAKSCSKADRGGTHTDF